MKKTIQDLKIGDSVWSQNTDNEPKEWYVDLISSSRLVLKTSSEYNREAPRRLEDLTAFKFIGKREGSSDKYYETTFYTEKIDVLKACRKSQEENIENVYNQQTNFLERLKKMNDKIRNTDELIAIELKAK